MARISTIYIKPVGGLCNRMRAIDSCVSLAEDLGSKVTVFWGRDYYLNCKFSDLFQPSEYYNVIEEGQHFGKKILFPYLPGSRPESSFKNALYKFTKSILSIEKEIWFEDLQQALLPLETSISPSSIRNMRVYEDKAMLCLAPFINDIKQTDNVFLCSAWRIWPDQNYKHRFTPISHLDNKITEVTGHFNNTIGIHIRRGDHNLAIQYSNLKKFAEAIRNELQKDCNKTFFLATDCLNTELELKKTFPDKIITFNKESYNRNSTSGIQNALVDLYCLSKTEKVLGSYFSSFSQIAAEISGIEEHTVN